MNYIHKFDIYNSINFDTPNEIILESLGIPNFLKEMTNDIFNEIDSLPYNKTINILNNNISLNIDIYNKDEIYGISSPTVINIYSKENYNKIDLKRTLTHELLHVYEFHKRIGKTKKKLEYDILRNSNILGKRYKDDTFIQDFSYILYLSSKHEISARVAETYTILIDKKTNDYDVLKDELIKTSAYKCLIYIKNFNYYNYNINYDNLIEFLNSLNRNFKSIDFKIFNEVHNINECNKVLDKWQILFNKRYDKFNKKLNRIIYEVINDYNSLM